MLNKTIKHYCSGWSGLWVVAGVRKATEEEKTKFEEEWPLMDWNDEHQHSKIYRKYLQQRDKAYQDLTDGRLNMSREFESEEDAREWFIECAKKGATHLTLMDPETFTWAVDALDENNRFQLMPLRLVAKHIKWFLKE